MSSLRWGANRIDPGFFVNLLTPPPLNFDLSFLILGGGGGQRPRLGLLGVEYLLGGTNGNDCPHAIWV